MRTSAEFVEVVRTGIESALEDGILLVRGAYGVVWNRRTMRWDPEDAIDTSTCDAIGAVLLAQPDLSALSHLGDPHLAAAIVWDDAYSPTEDVWLRITDLAFIRARN